MGSGFKYTLGLLGGTVALVAQLALGTFSIVTMGVTAGVAAYCKQRLIKVESKQADDTESEKWGAPGKYQLRATCSAVEF